MFKMIRHVLITVVCLLLGILAFLVHRRLNEPSKAPSPAELQNPANQVTPHTNDRWAAPGTAFNYSSVASEDTLTDLEQLRFGTLEDSTILQLCEDYIVDEGIVVGTHIPVPSAPLKDMIENRKRYRDLIVGIESEYETVSRDSADLKRDVEEYLKTSAAVESSLPGSVSHEELHRQVVALIGKGVTDPYIRSIAVAMDSDQKPSLKAEQLQQYASDMKQQGYSALLRAIVLQQALHTSHVPNIPDSRPYALEFAQSMCDQLAVTPNDHESQKRMCQRMTTQLAALNVKPMMIVYEAMLRDHRIDNVFLHLAAGLARSKIGWQDRTGNAASDVGPEQWKLFSENLRIARLHLRVAWLTHPEWTFAPTAMIPIAMAGEDEWSTRQWFELAVRAEFDNQLAYRAYNFSLRPEWGGGPEQVIEFGTECVATNAFGTLVPLQLFQGVDAYASWRGELEIWKSPRLTIATQKCADAFDVWLKSPESQNVDRLALCDIKSWLFGLLTHFGDNQRAARLLRSLDCPENNSILSRYLASPDLAIAGCLALSGPHNEEISQVNKHFQAAFTQRWSPSDVERSLETVRVTRLSEPGNRTAPYLDLMDQIIPVAAKFGNSPPESCALSFLPKLHMWQIAANSELQPDGSLKLRKPDTPWSHYGYICCRFELPRPLTISVVVEPPPSLIKPGFQFWDLPARFVVTDKTLETAPRDEMPESVAQQHVFTSPEQTGVQTLRLELTDSSATMFVNNVAARQEPLSNIKKASDRSFKGAVWIGVPGDGIIRNIVVKRAVTNSNAP